VSSIESPGFQSFSIPSLKYRRRHSGVGIRPGASGPSSIPVGAPKPNVFAHCWSGDERSL
jgi:hypothetical protein